MENDYDADRRRAMVREQIRSRGICDEELLAVLEKVPRHLFIPPEFRYFAYSDNALPSISGQTISQPYVVAKMTELLLPGKGKKVLEIGTGTGYQTAVLAELFSEVYSIEIIPDLYEFAKSNLAAFEYKNIKLILGNGYEGYAEAAPYDAIIVTAAPPFVPEMLLKQLSAYGRMVIPVGTFSQMLYLITANEDRSFKRKEIFPVVFVPMKRK